MPQQKMTLADVEAAQRRTHEELLDGMRDQERAIRVREILAHVREHREPRSPAFPSKADTHKLAKALQASLLISIFANATLSKTATNIAKPPCHRWVEVLSFIYSAKTYERVFAPHIADVRHEHCEALAAGEERKARWISARGNLIVIAMIFAHVPTTAMKFAAKVWSLGR